MVLTLEKSRAGGGSSPPELDVALLLYLMDCTSLGLLFFFWKCIFTYTCVRTVDMTPLAKMATLRFEKRCYSFCAQSTISNMGRGK
jgi:hypothetical protein